MKTPATSDFQVLICSPAGYPMDPSTEPSGSSRCALKLKAFHPSELPSRLDEAQAIVLQEATLTDGQLESATKCQAIIHAGRGAAGINLELARRLGIFVVSVPEAGTTFYAGAGHAYVEQFIDQWNGPGLGHLHERRRRPRLGLLGFGRIGMALASSLAGQRLDIWAHDPFALEESFETRSTRRIPLIHDLVGSADILLVQVSRATGNRRLIGSRLIEFAKRGMWLVNLGWPGAIDFDALASAVATGQLAKVALAVGESDCELPVDSSAQLSRSFERFDPLEGKRDEVRSRSMSKAIELVSMLAAGKELGHLLIDPPFPRAGA